MRISEGITLSLTFWANQGYSHASYAPHYSLRDGQDKVAKVTHKIKDSSHEQSSIQY